MKVCSINTISNVKINRNLLKNTSVLQNLNGGTVNDIVKDMIIPGGLTKFEKLYYSSTGNYPKSVMSRWFEKGTDGKLVQAGDYEVKIGSHLSGDPDYDAHQVDIDDCINDAFIGNDEATSEDNGKESFLDKLIDIFTGNY